MSSTVLVTSTPPLFNDDKVVVRKREDRLVKPPATTTMKTTGMYLVVVHGLLARLDRRDNDDFNVENGVATILGMVR